MGDQVEESRPEESRTNQKTGSAFTFKRFILISVALFPLIGYVIGYSYHEAYLMVFGVSVEAFPLSIQNVYMKAYEAFVWATHNATMNLEKKLSSELESTLWALLMISTYVGIGLLATNDSLKRYVDNHLENRSNNNQNSDAPKWFQKVSIRVLLGCIVSVLISVILMSFILVLPAILFYIAALIYILGQSQGDVQGNNAINDYKENNGCFYQEGERWSNCMQLIASDGKTILQEGILIVQVGKRIAFYNGEHSVILDIPEGASIKKMVNPELLKKQEAET